MTFQPPNTLSTKNHEVFDKLGQPVLIISQNNFD